MEVMKSPLLDGDTRDGSIVLPALQKLLQRAYSDDTDEQLQVNEFPLYFVIGFVPGSFGGSKPAHQQQASRTHHRHERTSTRHTHHGLMTTFSDETRLDFQPRMKKSFLAMPAVLVGAHHHAAAA